VNDDEPKKGAPSPHPPRKRRLTDNKRITLAFRGPPLAKPGESASLPPREADQPQQPAPKSASEEKKESHDAWSRDRVARGSGVHRAYSAEELAEPPPNTPKSKEGGALDLVNRRRPSEPNLDLAAEMTERFALDDFTGALRAAELILGRTPGHEDALRYAKMCRERLAQLYTARLSAVGTIPRLAVPSTEIRWLGIDNRAGFLLSRIDGAHTIDELVDISGMPRLEVLKTLTELLDAGTITLV
jgi:hypothetical protein